MPNIKPHGATTQAASRNEQDANLITAAGFPRWKPPHDPTISEEESPAGVCNLAAPAGQFRYDKKNKHRCALVVCPHVAPTIFNITKP